VYVWIVLNGWETRLGACGCRPPTLTRAPKSPPFPGFPSCFKEEDSGDAGNNGKHIAGADQVEISKWFNPLESTFYKHPMSPHPDVFRVSNDAAMGCTGVGRTGWHVDGSFQPSPFSHALYHIWSCPSQGETIAWGRLM
jgi:hypothetical protein